MIHGERIDATLGASRHHSPPERETGAYATRSSSSGDDMKVDSRTLFSREVTGTQALTTGLAAVPADGRAVAAPAQGPRSSKC